MTAQTASAPALTFDHIVIGAGTAGCLLANRLSADRNRRVLLIEAGGRDNYHWIHIPVGYLYCIGNPRTDWLYFTEPDAGLNGRKLRYPRGKVLGGCSSINGMIYMRGQARDYDGWAAGLWRRHLALGPLPAALQGARRPLARRQPRAWRGRLRSHRRTQRRRMARRKTTPALGHPGRLGRSRRAGRHRTHR
jgi:hypothetical protein